MVLPYTHIFFILLGLALASIDGNYIARASIDGNYIARASIDGNYIAMALIDGNYIARASIDEKLNAGQIKMSYNGSYYH